MGFISEIGLKLKKIPGLILLILALLLTISLIRNIFRILSARDKLEQTRSKVQQLGEENQDLKLELESLNTDQFLEKQARDKLGLVKQGETVIVLPDEEELKKLAPKTTEEPETLPDPNWKKWLNLFL